MSKNAHACTRCQRPRRRPGLCSQCAYEDWKATQPPPRPMSRKTAEILTLLSTFSAGTHNKRR